MIRVFFNGHQIYSDHGVATLAEAEAEGLAPLQPLELNELDDLAEPYEITYLGDGDNASCSCWACARLDDLADGDDAGELDVDAAAGAEGDTGVPPLGQALDRLIGAVKLRRNALAAYGRTILAPGGYDSTLTGQAREIVAQAERSVAAALLELEAAL